MKLNEKLFAAVNKDGRILCTADTVLISEDECYLLEEIKKWNFFEPLEKFSIRKVKIVEIVEDKA